MQCEPIHGWGFRRGGYQCRCKPGWRLPSTVRRPFLGELVERADEDMYRNGYDCMKIGWIHKTPIQWERAPYHVREKYLDMYHEYRNVSQGAAALHTDQMNIDQALKFIIGVNEKSCRK